MNWFRIACAMLCIATLPALVAQRGWRAGSRAWAWGAVSGLLIYCPTRAADVWLGDVAGWCVLLITLASWIFGRSPLGQLNFLVLQWFGVRLTRVRQRVPMGDGPGPECFKHVRWSLLRWAWPLTGWWSDYRAIGRGPVRW